MKIVIFISLFLAVQLCSCDNFEHSIKIDSSYVGQVAKVCITNPTNNLQYFVVEPTKLDIVLDTIVQNDFLDSSITLEILDINLNLQYDNRHCGLDSLFQTASFPTIIKIFPITYTDIGNGLILRKQKKVASNALLRQTDKQEYEQFDEGLKIELYGTPSFRLLDIKKYSPGVGGSTLCRDVERELTKLGYTGLTIDNLFTEKEKEIINFAITERGFKPYHLSEGFLDDIGVEYQTEDCLCENEKT